MALGSNHLTITSQANMIPEIWMDEVRAYLMANLVMAKLVKNFMFEGRKGDILRVPDVTELTANTKAANTAVTFNSNVEGVFSLTIDQHKECSVMIEDFAAIQSSYDLRSIYTKAIGYALAKKIDSDLWTLQSGLGNRYVAGTNNGWTTAFNGTNQTQGASLTETAIRKAIERLETADVPDDGGRFLAIPPTEKNALLAIPRFTEYQMLGPGGLPIRSGQFGEIFGLPVYVTTQACVVATAVTSLVMHGNAFAIAIQNSPRVQAGYVIDFLGTALVGDVVYGFAEFRDNHAIALYTAR